ncbi:MAG: hypothetical protein ACQEVA_07265 [Myxococcota bacterium]
MNSLRKAATILVMIAFFLLAAACSGTQSIGQKLAQTCFQSCQARYQVCSSNSSDLGACIESFRQCQTFCR